MSVPVRPAHHLVDAAGLGPSRRELLDAGPAAMDEHHVRIFLPGAVQFPKHRVGVAVPSRPRSRSSVPSGRFSFAFAFSRARMKSRASIDAEVRTPERLVWDPVRGRHISPVCARY